MELILIIGAVGSMLAAIAFIPQISHILSLKDTRALSWSSQFLFAISNLCGLIYSIAIKAYPFLGLNLFMLICSCIIICCKWRWEA